MADFCEDGHLICPKCGEHIEPEVPGKLAAQISIGLIGGLVSMGMLSVELIEDAIKAFQSEGAEKALRALVHAHGQMMATAEQVLANAAAIDAKGKPEPD